MSSPNFLPPPLGDDDRPPRSGVVVPYHRFTERRELRGRMMAALVRREEDGTMDAEFRAVEPVEAPKSLDEKS